MNEYGCMIFGWSFLGNICLRERDTGRLTVVGVGVLSMV